jgi:hypothetical protein
MKRLNFEAPAMELINIGAEDIICTSEQQTDPHFVKGNDATVNMEQKNFNEELF